MNADRLRGRVVIDPDTASRLGTVTDYWLDVASGAITALGIRGADVDQPQRVSAARVAHAGRDAIMLIAARDVSTAPIASLPNGWLNRHELQQLVVYTDTGDRLGRVAAVDVDPSTLAIQGYALAGRGWRRWLPFWRAERVAPERVVWSGRQVLVARTAETVKLRPAGLEGGFVLEASRRDGRTTPPPRERLSTPAA